MMRLGLAAVALLMPLALDARTPPASGGGQQTAELPSGFRGKVTYSGSFSQTTPGSARRVAGSVEVELEFDGTSVKGSYHGLLPVGRGELSGTRENGVCHLTNALDGTVWEGACDARSFAGTVAPPAGGRVRFNASFDTARTQLVDYAELDRQRADADKARAAAAARSQAAAPAPIASTASSAKPQAERPRDPALKPAPDAIALALELAVENDSFNWLFNRYEFGTIHDVRMGPATANGIPLKAYYSFNGGREGWVEAIFRAGKIQCLHFWDQGYCNPPRIYPAPPGKVAFEVIDGGLGDYSWQLKYRSNGVGTGFITPITRYPFGVISYWELTIFAKDDPTGAISHIVIDCTHRRYFHLDSGPVDQYGTFRLLRFKKASPPVPLSSKSAGHRQMLALCAPNVSYPPVGSPISAARGGQ